jgi:hypothetical protein
VGLLLVWIRGVDKYNADYLPKDVSGVSDAQPSTPRIDTAQLPPPGSVAVEIIGGNEATVDTVNSRNSEKAVVIKDVEKSKTSNVTHDPLANQAPHGEAQPSTKPATPSNANAAIKNVEVKGFQRGVVIKNAPTTDIENLSVDTKPPQP